jgi:hypothetical protein
MEGKKTREKGMSRWKEGAKRRGGTTLDVWRRTGEK